MQDCLLLSRSAVDTIFQSGFHFGYGLSLRAIPLFDLLAMAAGHSWRL